MSGGESEMEAGEGLPIGAAGGSAAGGRRCECDSGGARSTVAEESGGAR